LKIGQPVFDQHLMQSSFGCEQIAALIVIGQLFRKYPFLIDFAAPIEMKSLWLLIEIFDPSSVEKDAFEP
jgi:hypothetical protein